jgi:hypothetical protein
LGATAVGLGVTGAAESAGDAVVSEAAGLEAGVVALVVPAHAIVVVTVAAMTQPIRIRT